MSVLFLKNSFSKFFKTYFFLCLTFSILCCKRLLYFPAFFPQSTTARVSARDKKIKQNVVIQRQRRVLVCRKNVFSLNIFSSKISPHFHRIVDFGQLYSQIIPYLFKNRAGERWLSGRNITDINNFGNHHDFYPKIFFFACGRKNECYSVSNNSMAFFFGISKVSFHDHSISQLSTISFNKLLSKYTYP